MLWWFDETEPFLFLGLVRDKCGTSGKATWCVQHQVDHVFDDNDVILRESLSKGSTLWPIPELNSSPLVGGGGAFLGPNSV